MKNVKILLLCLLLLLTVSSSVLAYDPYEVFRNEDSRNNWYDRAASKNYLNAYSLTPNSAYREFGNDCTNFSSQVLEYANMAEDYIGLGGGNAWEKWYYNSYYIYSHSWTVAHDFRYHWGCVNNVGRERAFMMNKYLVTDLKNTWAAWYDLYNSCSTGDILQYVDANGQTVHNQIVYERRDDGYKIIASQHTSNYKERDVRAKSLNTEKYKWIVLIRIKMVQLPVIY